MARPVVFDVIARDRASKTFLDVGNAAGTAAARLDQIG